MKNIIRILFHFLGIIFLRRKPQDLQYSINLFIVFATFILIISNQIVYYLEIDLFSNIFFSILVSNFSFLLIIYFFLHKEGLSQRFVQTASNLLGIEILNFVLFYIIIYVNNNINKYYIHFFISFIISIWFFIIRVHIVKHSFNYNTLKSLIYCFIFFIMNFFVTYIISFLLSPIFLSIT